MNNKGQTLVTFVLIIPLIIILFIMTLDFGNMLIQKRKAENSIKSTIKYGLKNIEKENLEKNLENLLKENLDNNKIDNLKIEIKEKEISVTLNIHYDKIFKDFLYDNKIELKYIGNINNNDIVIKRGELHE